LSRGTAVKKSTNSTERDKMDGSAKTREENNTKQHIFVVNGNGLTSKGNSKIIRKQKNIENNCVCSWYQV
jgi:hypothetical protein